MRESPGRTNNSPSSNNAQTSLFVHGLTPSSPLPNPLARPLVSRSLCGHDTHTAGHHTSQWRQGWMGALTKTHHIRYHEREKERDDQAGQADRAHAD